MPYPPQVFSLDGHAYGLTVSGVQVIDWVPLDLAPIRWEMPSESTTGGISFTVEDFGNLSLPSGSVVRWTDNVNNELLASGVLVNRRYSRGIGPLRQVECDVAGWGWFLDHRIVTEYAWPASGYVDDHIKNMVTQFGGPLMPRTGSDSNYETVNGGTATRTTVRSAIDSLHSDTIDTNPFHVYVNDEAVVRWFGSVTGDAALGTATYSIGDQGDFVPENVTYEVGSDNRANLVAAYGTASDFVGWAWVGPPAYAVSPWDAGQPSTYWVDNVGFGNPDVAAQWDAYINHGDITSVTFTTQDHGGWKPHQAIVIDDSILTGGTAQVHYIASVSGQTIQSNAIEYRVTTGAVARSIVQTVATP